MNRDLLLVAIALFTWGLGESTYRLFQPLYLEQLGASPLEIGTILGGVGIAMTVVHIPAGFLADKFGRRMIMWTAWILGVLSGIIMAAARSLPVFTIGVLLYGVTALVIAPMNSYITAARGTWSVGRAIAFTAASYNIGAVLGPLFGGAIGDRFGYATMYLFATIIFGVSTIFILFLKSQPVEVITTEATSSNGLSNRLFLGFLPILFMANLAMYISQPLASNFLQNSHNLSLSQIGLLGSIGSMGSVVLSLAFGYMNAGMGFIFAQLATIFFPLLLWRGNGITWFAIGHFMLGGFRAARAMSIAQLRNYISSAKMGLAYGIAETTSGIAIILASIMAGYLYEIIPERVFQTAIGLTLISVFITTTFTRKVAHKAKGETNGISI
jgi:MFS family permease